MSSKEGTAQLSHNDRERLLAQLNKLHERGLIDLDAPLADAVPFFQKVSEQATKKVRLGGAGGEQQRPDEWYCFIGDIFIACKGYWEW